MKNQLSLVFAILILVTVACNCPKLDDKDFGKSPDKPAETTDDGGIKPAESPSDRQAGITMAKFKEIKTGMKYDEVVKIIGKEGEEMSSTEFGRTTTAMYQWKGEGYGAVMTAMFQNDKLISKSQMGLE